MICNFMFLSIFISSSKENYFDLNKQFLAAYNFCYERARDIISFPVDRKLKSINYKY